jgi:hypothetical protein
LPLLSKVGGAVQAANKATSAIAKAVRRFMLNTLWFASSINESVGWFKQPRQKTPITRMFDLRLRLSRHK